MIYHYPIS